MKACSTGLGTQPREGRKRCMNSELWHACAGPLVSLPAVGSRVVYFPQGHSEQVAASTNKEADSHIPNYPSLPPQLICQLHDMTMHADMETDEVYAQMTLQPLTPQEQNDVYLPTELGTQSKQPTNYFCKTLTASDTSTHGGFSVPRRAAEKVFPPLDFSLSPPAQELVARDLHGNEWKFRHIFRGQPKRHLLTTGWSVFVSAKRLVAGDSVLFIWNENNQLLLGIRRANRPQTVLPSSVLSSDSMHIGLLAAAAHAAATNSRFTIFYNPRASPSEFVIPLAKYVKSVYDTRVSVGMRFRMLFETEESSVRRYMGTITGIGDQDPLRWPKSHWRSVKVGWDESTAGDRQPMVSLWEIEPLTTFPLYPPFPFRLKRPWLPGIPSLHDAAGKGEDIGLYNALEWPQESERVSLQPCLSFHGVSGSSSPWIQPRLDGSFPDMQYDVYHQPADLQLQVLHQFPLPQPSSQQPPFLQGVQDGQDRHPFRSMHDGHAHRPRQGQVPPHFLPPQLHLHHQGTTSSYTAGSQKLLPQPPLPSISSPPCPPFNVSVASSSVSPLRGILGGCFSPEETTVELLNVQQPWSNKRAAVELAPPPSRSVGQGDLVDSQSSILFGVNIEQSSLLGDDSPAGAFGPMSYRCRPEAAQLLDEPPPALLEVKPHDGTFLKVHKTGCCGRLLDITRFNSYPELRSELGRMFGLEGQLEDPLRSGWQLVFVDREGDVLLVGDDPWQEFVNSVWSIRILSPQEVQQMGKQGVSSTQAKGLPSTSGGGGGGLDDYVNHRSASGGGLSTGIMSVGAFDY